MSRLLPGPRRMTEINTYSNPEAVQQRLERHDHRGLVGGMWEEIGKLQLDFLISQGLLPAMKLLDIGCGCLRGGVHFVSYLESGNYYGIDGLQQLLDAGMDVEIPALGLTERLPRENLLCDWDFSAARFGVGFDIAIAQSVFTHLPLNHIRQCLSRIAPAMKSGSRFFATMFAAPDADAWHEPLRHEPGGITTFPTRDPYHYCFEHLEMCAESRQWKFDVIGQWGHPRDQQMVCFTRLGDS